MELSQNIIFRVVLGLSVAAFFYGLSIGINLSTSQQFLHLQGLSTADIGKIISCEMLSPFLLAGFVPLIISKLGLFRVIVISLIFRNICLSSIGFLDSKIAWMAAYSGYGMGGFMLFLTIQLWINRISNSKNRATNFGILNVSFALGISSGPPLLILMSVEPNSLAYVLSAAFCAILLIPIIMIKSHIPNMGNMVRIRFKSLLERAQIPVMGGMVVDYIFFSVGNFILIYGLYSGLSQNQSRMLVSYMILSSIILDIPIGYIIDRFNRRMMLIIFAIGSIICAQLLPYAILNHMNTIILFGMWSGCVSGIYITSLSILGDNFEGSELVSANAALSVMNAAGAYMGIYATGIAIDKIGANGLVLSVTSISAAFLLFNLIIFFRKDGSIKISR